MRKSVVSGLSFFSVSEICVPSIFETKNTRKPSFQKGFRASVTITGPRSLPPIPIFTMSVTGFPEKPSHFLFETLSAKAFILFWTRLMSCLMSRSSRKSGSSEKLRRAVWRTARFSVSFIFSPLNIASIPSFKPASSARPKRVFITSSSTRFFE